MNPSQPQISLCFTPPLEPAERAVWNALQSHRGRSRAIRKSDLARATGMHERAMRSVLKSLVEKRGKRIGSTPTHPSGYFIIETDDEAWECCERYHRHAISVLVREMKLRGIARHELIGQLDIELEREERV